MSQNSIVLPTTGTVSGLTLANDINAALDTLLTNNSGASAPSSPELGQMWINTTSATFPTVERYTGAGWVVEGVIDVANGIWIPVVGGGIGTVASAATTDLGSTPQLAVAVTGSATITSLGSSCAIGQEKQIIFAGAMTLTYNAGSLIIPGGVSINTTSGDVARGLYLGGGNWRILEYVPISTPTKSTPTTSDFILIQDAAAANAPKKSTLLSILGLVGGTRAGATGLVIGNNATTPNSVIDIAADSAVMTNSGTPFYASPISVSINTSTTGANGLDTGSRAANTWYNLFLISNGGGYAALASLSATAPTMPSGYTYLLRVGAMLTDGSGNFYRTKQRGARAQYQIVSGSNTATYPVIVNTVPGVGSYTSTSVLNFLPPTAKELFFQLIQNTLTGVCYIAANTGFTPSPINCVAMAFTPSGSASAISVSGSLLLETTNIGYANNGSSGGVVALGWTDKVNAS